MTTTQLDPDRFPFDGSQARLSAAAAQELGEPLELAALAAGHLADAVWQTELPAPESDPPGAAHDRRAAVNGLAVLGVRTARALILLVVNGWEPEAHALKRRLTEAVLRARQILDDDSGEAARQWLENRASSAGARFDRYGAKTPWRARGSGSHADVRSLQLVTSPPRSLDVPADQRSVTMLPERNLRHAHGLLLDAAWDAGLLVAGLAQSLDGAVAFDASVVERMRAARAAYEQQWTDERADPSREAPSSSTG